MYIIKSQAPKKKRSRWYGFGDALKARKEKAKE